MEKIDLRIVDTIFDPDVYGAEPYPRVPNDKPLTAYYHKSANSSLYKVWLFVTGNHLPFVEKVTYQLHETFSEPVQTARRTLRNPNCQLVIWTWGVFMVNATVLDKSGRTFVLNHELDFEKLLQEYDGRIKYIQGNP